MITKHDNIISRHEVNLFGNLKTTIRKSTSTFENCSWQAAEVERSRRSLNV